MNRAGVILRIGLETLLAFFCSLNVPVSGLKLLMQMSAASTAYIVGSCVGLAVQAVLCLLLIQDVIRMVWRLQARTAAGAD